MNTGRKIGGGVQVLDVAFHDRGLRRPNPFDCTLEQLSEYDAVYQRLLHEACGDLGMGDPDPKPELCVPQHDGRLICATAFGAPYPTWDTVASTWWVDPDQNAWDGIRDVSDVEQISIPDWATHPMVRQMAAKWEEFRGKVDADTAADTPIGTAFPWRNPATGDEYRFSHFISFIDMGQNLMGAMRFFEVLAGDPEMAAALLAKCFAISSSYAAFMDNMYGRTRRGFCSMGGDNSCLLSPDMFRRYGMGFDKRVMDECHGLPCNLHSCGPSKHLYEVWAEYPRRETIVLMQTRAMPGAMKALRASLPCTHVQLTIHQPQIEFERETPDRVRELVWEFAEAMDFRDVTISVLVSWVNDRVKENIRAFQAALHEADTKGRTLDAG